MEGIFVQALKTQSKSTNLPWIRKLRMLLTALLKELIKGFSLGEADPEDLQVILDLPHLIEKMWMNGDDGHGRLKLLPTPMGNICKTLLECGAKLGVSSRGSGEVGHDGIVKGFEIQTVDIVKSAIDAYPNL